MALKFAKRDAHVVFKSCASLFSYAKFNIKNTKSVLYYFCSPVRTLTISCVNETKIYHYDVQM